MIFYLAKLSALPAAEECRREKTKKLCLFRVIFQKMDIFTIAERRNP